MRVLWITPHLPDSQGSGGSVHQFELLRWIAARHEITLLTTDWSVRRGKSRIIQELGVEVQTVPYRSHPAARKRLSKSIGLLRGAAPTLTVWSQRHRLGPLAEAVIAAERAHTVDLVCIVMGELAPIVDAARAPTSLLLFDVYSRISDRVQRGDRWFRTVRRRLEQHNARRWEPHWYKRANGVACVSSVDADVLSTMLGRSVVTIPNPVPDEFFSPPQCQRSSTTVTFVGSFTWEPNIDSVRWICEEIWPRVLARRPDAKLRIVGRTGFLGLQRHVEAIGGEIFSDVEDIRPYYWEAAVIIAPIRMGSGMRNKILHAMACRAPLVATSSALEGIPATAGEHLLVADDADGLADAVVAVLNDPKSAAERAEVAREIPVRYSSAAAGAALEAWWDSIARQRPADLSEGAAASRPTPSASIVVCTRERPELLRRSLVSLGAAAAGVPGTEIIIVEQGEPSAGRICSELGLPAKVVSDDGRGASRARNIGLRHARGDAVLFTDDDCEVPPDWVRRHVDALTDPEVIASFGEVSGLSRWGDEGYDPASLPARHGRNSAPWLIGHSSNMCVLRATLYAVGGFDERLGPGSASQTGGEDADVIVRLLRTGFTTVSGTGEAVRHIEWRSSDEHRATLISYEHGAGVWIGKALREHPRAALALLRWRIQLLRDYAANGKTSGDNSVPVTAFAGALTRGLISGLRMAPWRG